MGRLQKLGIKGTHEDAGCRNWVPQEHMRMLITETGITVTHEDIGYRNWASQDYMRMLITETGHH